MVQGMNAITTEEIEAASVSMEPVMIQMSICDIASAFVIGANWAINEIDRRKVNNFPSIPSEEPQD